MSDFEFLASFQVQFQDRAPYRGGGGGSRGGGGGGGGGGRADMKRTPIGLTVAAIV